jgi:hypothetical protein
MTNPHPDNTTTKLWRLLQEQGRSQAWLARKLRVRPQSVGAWVRAEEPCPRNRQAQIALHLSIAAADFFDRHGFAVLD